MTDGATRANLPATERLDRLRLARTEGIGPVNFRKLLCRCGSASDAIEALPTLAHAGGRKAMLAVPPRAAAEREMARVAALGGTMLFLGDPGYPELLALLDTAPPVLCVLGDPAALGAGTVALVGARNASVNGRRLAELLAADLAGAGLVVVSGLARGIDAAAHEGALRAGRTVAVVAGGLDQPYPPEQADLQRRIAEGGCVVGEAPLGTVPRDRHFPRRNRIIAGLSLGVVVVEAALRSGSLITAKFAQDAGRELYAAPGSPLDPRNRGTNDLIRQGAHLVESASDVLEHLPQRASGQQPAQISLFGPKVVSGIGTPMVSSGLEGATGDPDLDSLRPGIVARLSPSPTAVDDLVRDCQVPAAAVLAVLLELELAGRIETLPGNRICLLAAE